MFWPKGADSEIRFGRVKTQLCLPGATIGLRYPRSITSVWVRAKAVWSLRPREGHRRLDVGERASERFPVGHDVESDPFGRHNQSDQANKRRRSP